MNLVERCKLKEFRTETEDGETLICYKVRRGAGFEIKRLTFEEIAEEHNRKLRKEKAKRAGQDPASLGSLPETS